MIPTYELNDDQWNTLVQDVAEHFGEVMINRGFQYYKRGRVVKLTIPSQRQVKALVEGSDLYQVELNLDFFTASRCECPVGSYCKHMFAAILKYADLHNRPIHPLVNAKSLVRATEKADAYQTSYNQAKQLAAQKAAMNLERIKTQAAKIPELNVEQWHAWFALAAERLMQGPRNTQFVNDALAAIYRHKPSLPGHVEAFFVLHAHFFVLSKLTKQPQDQSGYIYSYLAFHTHHAASDLQESIGQRIRQAASLAQEPQNASRAVQTLDYLRREMLAETNENRYFLFHYFDVWSHWLLPSASGAAQAKDESGRLADTAKELGPTVSSVVRLLAESGIRMFLSDDEEAWKLLNKADETTGIPAELLLAFLSHLEREAQWTRLADWLARIAPLINARRSGDMRAYAEFWERAARKLPEAEPRMWEALVSMLPQSKALYVEKLAESGQWERWMDFHLSMDGDPMDFRVTELAPIEKNAPELLLPFYHQAVERYVSLKNRDSYKTAVRLLKRLAKLYKKTKQEARWEAFLASFADKHSRLRALQEELRKGKLRHDD
ncbi:SWIM zinc finger domain-containing protein [Paenibacillaceae bacterium WGS1546]|uniref:SWIM zinc finger family protein n=1 Tax=Cohnella sp. WGS1546 TaxID=3366810 RepID=UPI00372D1CED